MPKLTPEELQEYRERYPKDKTAAVPFTPGDRVVIIWGISSYIGCFATVETSNKTMTRIVLESGLATDRYTYKLAPVAPPFVPSNPVRTRSGIEVTIEETGDPDRPYRARVPINGQPTMLTYGPSGHFYKHYNSDVDLVNA